MLLSAFLLFLAIQLSRSASPCITDGPCSCTFGNGTKIDLNGYESSDNKKYVEVDTTSDTYRFYPCGVTVPWGDDCDDTATACQYSKGDVKYYSLGQTKKYEVQDAKLDGENSYLTIQYSGGSIAVGHGNRKCDVMMKCVPKGTSDSLMFINEDPTIEYHLEFHSTKACPMAVPQPSGGGGGGANGAVLFIVLIVVLFLAVVTYLVVGILLMVFWKGARGLEIIPNFEFWKDFPFLLKDGFLFTFSCFPQVRDHIGQSRSYTSLK